MTETLYFILVLDAVFVLNAYRERQKNDNWLLLSLVKLILTVVLIGVLSMRGQL